MGFTLKSNDLIRISTFESLKIYISGVFWGFWYVLTVVLSSLWNSKKDTSEKRGSPPLSLIDSSIGNHSFVKIKGVKFHFVEAGSRGDPLLILLHGFPDCWITWRKQIPEFAKYYRVVAVDLKGFGDSDKPTSRSSYHVTRVVEELDAFVSSQTLGRVTLVGHGLGALVAWYYVHFRPDNVDKFVALSCPHPNLYWSQIPYNSLFNNRWISLVQLPILPEMKAMEKDLKIINLAHEYLSSNKPSDKEYLDGYKYLFSRSEDWRGALNYYRNFPFWQLPKKKLNVPTLLLAGNTDGTIKLETIIKSTDYLERFSLKLVEGASHYLHQEDADEVNRIIIDFFNVGKCYEDFEKSSNGIVNRMFGAVSSTMRYGNSVFDVFHKTTGGLTSRALSIGQNA